MSPKVQSPSVAPAIPAPAATKRGRKPGKMTDEQKTAARERKFAKVLNSEEIKNVKAWKGVAEDQINAIIAIATKAAATAKTERVATLQAELAKLQATPKA